MNLQPSVPATSDSEPVSLIRTTPPLPDWMGDELARALSAVATRADIGTMLRYHKFAGSMADREAASLWLARRFEIPPAPDRIIVTNGTQNAMFITLATVVGRGGLLLTEELSYYGLRRIAGFLGVEIETIAMDDDGALPDAFEAACRTAKPKALFLTPTVHNPTTAVMSAERRLALADIARQYGVAIIEDDVYGMLPDKAPPTLAELAPDVTWHGTGLAKCVAPGLRIGYLVAPDAAQAARAFERFQVTSTWFVSPLSAVIAEFWIRDGIALKVLEAVRAEAKERQLLARRIFGNIAYRSDPAALHIWMDLPERWPQEQFVKVAAERGVVLRPGHMFALDPQAAPNAIRIVLGSPETRPALERALHTLADLLG